MKCADKSKLTIGLAIVRIIWQSESANAYTLYDYIDRRSAEGKRISKMVHRAVQQHHTIGGIVSKNPAIMKMFEILPTIANSESSLLITGESGTGKELLVKTIHNLSPRKDKPLITVNCAALPDTLIESELFGYKKGAFTDARQDKPGRFVQAEGGTLFLDEIGDVSPAMQVKLLRVLQEKTIEPLGSSETVKVNTRIIVATNRDLDRMIEDGDFRQDLYYRINVIKLELPPLRERIEDIPVLVEHFIGKFREMFGKDITSVSPAAIEVLMNYDYPGNIRELENFIEHAFLLCRGDKIIPEHLPEILRQNSQLSGISPIPPYANRDGLRGISKSLPSPSSIVEGDKGGVTKSSPPPASIKDSETNLIFECLERNNWNRTSTAKELGIHRITLSRKIKMLGIELPKLDGRFAFRNIP
ncbi:sigma-54-dependent Fis family transcriptional regulator [bacterium]|nr:sigma-54-dependent Fis family transcriptional regulator [bacterium]